jgi:hypothetical protein
MTQHGTVHRTGERFGVVEGGQALVEQGYTPLNAIRASYWIRREKLFRYPWDE